MVSGNSLVYRSNPQSGNSVGICAFSAFCQVVLTGLGICAFSAFCQMGTESWNLCLFSFLPNGNSVLEFATFQLFVNWKQILGICAFSPFSKWELEFVRFELIVVGQQASGNRICKFLPFGLLVKWEQGHGICAFWAFCEVIWRPLITSILTKAFQDSVPQGNYW